LKRFRHFINSDQVDNNVIFVEERGQIRPANDEERSHYLDRHSNSLAKEAV